MDYATELSGNVSLSGLNVAPSGCKLRAEY
jgi:hypothetical protein